MKREKYLGDEAILSDLGHALAKRRIGKSLTQAELAKQAGIGKRTVERIEGGNSCQTSALIRVFRVLDLQETFSQLVAPSGPTPMDLLKRKNKVRKRAPSQRPPKASHSGGQSKNWTWGDEA